MKKVAWICALWVAFTLFPSRANAQKEEIMQLTLNIQKLNQLKQILKQIKQGYEILVNGYNTIVGITKGNYNLHKGHLDGLLNVSPTVRNYERVKKVIEYQYLLVKEYKKAQDRFNSSGNFQPKELEYMANVYSNLLNQSLRNLDELTTVLTAGKTRMSDDERLQSIDRIYLEMEQKLNFLRQFNNSTGVLGMHRAKEKRNIQTVRSLHGTNQ